MEACFFSSERQKKGGSGWEGSRGETGREKHNQDILCEKRNLFSIRGRKERKKKERKKERKKEGRRKKGGKSLKDIFHVILLFHFSAYAQRTQCLTPLFFA